MMERMKFYTNQVRTVKESRLWIRFFYESEFYFNLSTLEKVPRPRKAPPHTDRQQRLCISYYFENIPSL